MTHYYSDFARKMSGRQGFTEQTHMICFDVCISFFRRQLQIIQTKMKEDLDLGMTISMKRFLSLEDILEIEPNLKENE